MTWRSDITLAKPATAADFAVLQFAFESGELWPIAVVLLDDQDRLYLQGRPPADLATRIPREEVEVVASSLDQIADDARADSGRKVLAALEDRLSNTIRISDRRKTHILNIQNTLANLYEQYVAFGE